MYSLRRFCNNKEESLPILKLVLGTKSDLETKNHWDMGSGGCMVLCRTLNRRDGGSIPPTAFSKLRQFHSPHICLCLLEETLKIQWFHLSGVNARGSKRSHTGGKCVTCSGLTNSREGQLLR